MSYSYIASWMAIKVGIAMASMTTDDLQGLVLEGVTPLSDRHELGREAYGRVYAVKYYGTICAAKEVHSVLVEGVEL